MPPTSLLASTGFGVERLLPREGEQPVGQRGGALHALQRHLPGPHDPRHGGRGLQSGNLPADRVEAALHDGEKVVEIVGDAAGELTDDFHLLRLAEQFLRLHAGFVLGFQLARALPDAFFQGLGESAQLRAGALSFGHVDVDADHAHRTPLGVVEHDAARLHPNQGAVRLDDAELGLHLARLRGERVLHQIDDAGLVLAIDAVEPALIASVELDEAVERDEFRREPHRPGLHLPLEDAEASRLLGEVQQFVAFPEESGCTLSFLLVHGRLPAERALCLDHGLELAQGDVPGKMIEPA